MKGAHRSQLHKALASSTTLIPTDQACSGSALAGIALSAALAGLLGLPLPHAWAQTFGGAGGTGSSGPGGAGGGFDMPGGSAPAGSNGGGGGGGPGLANAASGSGLPGGTGDGTGGAGGASGANGYDVTSGAFNSTASYAGTNGVAGISSASAGGGGGGAGGIGAVLQGRGTFGTTGELSGGYGGNGGNSGMSGTPSVDGSGAAGNGGIGVYLSGPLTFTVNSTGAVYGGNGGYGGTKYGPGVTGSSGNGGTGIYVIGGASLINRGAIEGGGGRYQGQAYDGADPGAGGAGGIGIVGSDLTIDNAGGTIAGGVSGDGTTQSYAVQLTGGTSYVGAGGTINGGINVSSGASFQPALPGSAVGTPLAINGPLVFARTATYQIRIAGAANDSAGLTGIATLNGAKVFVQVAGAAPVRGVRYTIVAADGGVAGKFRSRVGSSLAFFAPTLAYDDTRVYLESRYDFAQPALTVNEQRVGQALNTESNGAHSAAGARLLNGLELVSKNQGAAVLDSLSGEGITATQNLANRSAQMFNDAIFDQTTFYGSASTGNSITLTAPTPGFVALAPEQTLAASRAGQPVRELADLPASRVPPVFVAPQRTWRAWAQGFGGTEDIHGNAVIGSAYQQNTIYGGALGVDYQVLPNYLFGVAVGGSDGNFRVPRRTTSGSTTGGHIAIYDIATFGAFYGASSSSFSYFTNRTTRVVSGFGGLRTETERGDFDSHEFRQRLEFGRRFASLGMLGTVTPFVALEIADLRSNGFGERAVSGQGLFRLNVNGQSIADVPGYVGLRFQNVMPLGGLTLLPTLQIAYVHEFAPYRSQTNSIADLPGATFLIDGARPARDAAQVKAGGELRIGPHSALFANFDGELSGVNQLYAGKGGLKIAF